MRPREWVTQDDSRRVGGHLSHRGSLPTGMQVRSKYKGCAPSCKEAKETLQWIFRMSSLDQLDQLDPSLPKSELQSLTCCEKDLCNRGAQALGPCGGLLLSLAPASLWALL